MSDNPFAKYAPAASNNPFAKYRTGAAISSAPEAGKPTPDHPSPSFFQRAVHGFETPLVGLDMLASEAEQHIPFIPKETAARDLAISQQRQWEFAKRTPSGFDAAEFAGEMANPLNYIGAGKSILGAALGGATAAAVQPSSTTDYWANKAKQVAEGLVTGGAVGAAGKAVGRIIAPVATEPARRMAAAGVPLTPGQILQGTARTAESALRAFPIMGSFIRKAEQHSYEGFNRAVINQALDPIGGSLPKSLDIGRDSVRYAAQKIGHEFAQIWPRLNFHPDPQFVAQMQKLHTLVQELPPDLRDATATFIKNRVGSRMGQNFSLTGVDLAKVDSELGQKAANFRRSADPAQREAASVYTELQNMIRDAVERQHPKEAVAMRNARAAYAMLVRIENAAGSRRTSGGVFSPADLLGAIKSGSSRVRRRDFVHGDGLLQAFAEAGQKIIPETLPDSGTAERAVWNLLFQGLIPAAGGYGAGSGDFLPLLGTLGLGSAGAGLYTTPVQRALQAYLMPGATRQAVSDVVVPTIERFAAPAAGAIIGQTEGSPQ